MHEITVFFTSMEGFAELCKTKNPHEVVHLLNQYFKVVVECITDNGGSIDKYIGNIRLKFQNNYWS